MRDFFPAELRKTAGSLLSRFPETRRHAAIESSAMPAAERIAGWMRRQLAATGGRGFVVGLSGGIDSAVVARLAQLAAPGSVVAAILPCHSDPQDEPYAALVAKRFSMTTVRIDLSETYDTLITAGQAALQTLLEQTRATRPRESLSDRLPLANVKPRLRMTTLYYLANSLNYLVAGATNRSELAIGYFTKHGDGGADLLPIGHLVKSEVRALARELNMPSAIVERTPSAGLWMGQSDEEEMGFTYGELERYLDDGPQGVSPALAMRIERLTRSSEHKRALPPMPDPD
jgi:NAD+ synthase